MHTSHLDDEFYILNLACISRENLCRGFAVWMENMSHILGWSWHIQSLSYSTKVLWALEGERDKRRRIHINAITLHQACLFRWFLSRWRGRSNGHIIYKLSINVTDVGLTLDCRITHFYGSCGLLSKHNRDGGRPGLIAPSAPTLSLSLSLRGDSDVQTKSVDTTVQNSDFFSIPKKNPLTYMVKANLVQVCFEIC